MVLPGLLSKAIAVARHDGIRALLSKVAQFLIRPIQRYWYAEHYWEGKLVEWTGNKSRIENVVIDLDNPHIATQNKGALWKGIYEEPERRLFHRYFPLDMPVVELGASIGVVACITNRLLKDPQRHLVVEANPYLIPTLERNRTLNQCQFKIVNAAIAYDTDQVTFYLHDKFITGNLLQKADRSVTVPACSVQSLTEAEGLTCFNLICDIEGAEIALVQHEGDYLQQHVGWLLIDLHARIVGADQLKAMDEDLVARGFCVAGRFRRAVCYRNMTLVP